MEASLRFPFTLSQLKEFERQIMIYKHMMASVPVPPHLLLPIPTDTLSAYSSSPLLSNKDVDSRRCNRAVVSPHNYRKRPRKPVEDYAPFTKRTCFHPPPPTTPMAVPNPTLHTNNIHSLPLLGYAAQPTQTPLLVDCSSQQNHFASLYQDPNRRLDWMMEGEMVLTETSQQQRQHLMQTNICNTSASGFERLYRNVPPNVASYAEFGVPEFGMQNGDCHLLPNPDLQKWPQMETSTGFTTAGYTNDNTRQVSSVSTQSNFWPSSPILAMAMAAGNALDEEFGRLQVGLGVADSDAPAPSLTLA